MENKTQVYSDWNTYASCEKVLMDEEANVIWSDYQLHNPLWDNKFLCGVQVSLHAPKAD
jgi:hypothetical protein